MKERKIGLINLILDVIMKKIFSLCLASLAFLLAGCQEELQETIIDDQKPVELPSDGEVFSFKAEIASTKTILDAETYEMKWDDGDVVYLIDRAGVWDAAQAYTYSAVTGEFSSEAAIPSGTHVFNVLFTPENQKDYHKTSASTHYLYASCTQNQSAPTRHISSFDALAGSFTYASGSEIGQVEMAHLYTLMQVDLVNPSSEAVTVEKFTMAVDDGTYLNGVYSVDFDDLTALYDSKGTSMVTVNLTEGVIEPGASLPVYFIMAPLAEYEGKVTFKAYTADSKFTKTIDFSGRPLTFAAGKYNTAKFNLVAEPFVPSAYVLADSLEEGDEIIVASGSEGTVSVMGEQASNNRDAIQNITVDGKLIVSTPEMAVFRVGKGIANTAYYTFYDNYQEGYLYAASTGNNYLRTQSGIDVNSEWEVSITDGVASVIATGSENRNVMQYNSSSKLFSCYASASQSPVYLYKKTTATSVATVSYEAVLSYEAGISEIVYSVANPSGPTTVSSDNVNITDHDEEKKVITFSYTQNDTGEPRTFSVAISNNGKTIEVKIVQKPEPVKLVMSEITAVPAETSIYYSWEEVEGADGYAVKTPDGDWVNISQTSFTYTGLAAETSYTVQFKARGDGLDYTDSDVVSCTEQTTTSGNSVYYEKVTEAPDDWSGTYLIVFDNIAHSLVSGSNLTSSYKAALTITDNKILSEAGSSDLDAVVISKNGDGYKIKLSNDKYLTVPASNSVGNDTESNAAVLTLEYTANGVEISGVDSKGVKRYLCQNGSYFRMYKSVGSYILPTLYRLQDK